MDHSHRSGPRDLTLKGHGKGSRDASVAHLSLCSRWRRCATEGCSRLGWGRVQAVPAVSALCVDRVMARFYWMLLLCDQSDTRPTPIWIVRWARFGASVELAGAVRNREYVRGRRLCGARCSGKQGREERADGHKQS